MNTPLPLSGLTVLVVENDYLQADDARATLEQSGARVLGPFADEHASIASLKAQHPDCVLLDINLGAGLSFDIAQIAQALNISILFMTGYDQEAIPAEYHHIQRLTKPVPAAKLTAAISQLCGR